MTDEQIQALIAEVKEQLLDLQSDIKAIREAVLPDLGPIIAMHQGQRPVSEASSHDG